MDVAVELRPGRKIAVYRNVARAVDTIHAGIPIDPDEVREIPLARERLAPPPPSKVRTHELIPADDAWAWELVETADER